MIARFDWLKEYPKLLFASGEDKIGRRRDLITGWLLLGGLTAFLVAWFLYRWLAQPAWLEHAPPLAREFLFLLETAGAFTVTFLWTGLSWRRWRNSRPQPVLVADVAELYALSPAAFERYVAGLFRWKGYRVILRGRSGDHGVDLELIGPGGKRGIVQCKRYQHTVGEELVRELFGTLLHERAAHAFMVTTAEISPAAHTWARGKPITLIDGETLVRIAAALDESVRGGT